MGFYRLDEVIQAFKAGLLNALLADYNANDLGLLKHEVASYAEKMDLIADLSPLIEHLEFLIDERQAAEGQ
jgi:hypothetical protein